MKSTFLKSALILSLILAVFSGNAQYLKIEEVLLPTTGGFNFIWDVKFDNHGMLWACTENGVLVKYDGSEWSVIETPDGVFDLREMAFDKNNELWIATDGYGVLHYDNNEWVQFTTENSNLQSDELTAIAIDTNDVVYVASRFDEAGLCRYIGNDWVCLTESNSSLPDNFINDIQFDPYSARLWAGNSGNDDVISRIFGSSIQSWSLYDLFNSYPDVECIDIKRDSTIWFGTTDGIFHYDNGTWHDKLSFSDNLDMDEIKWDAAGNLWVYERFHGLYQYTDGKVYDYGSSDTIPSQIFGIEVDSNDFKYIWGNRGNWIIKFRESEIPVFGFGTNGAKWYYSEIAGGACATSCEYVMLESIGDSIINGQATNRISRTYYTYAGDTIEQAPYFMYERSDTVYMWSDAKDRFLRTYIFNGEVGDTLVLDVPDSLDQEMETYRLIIDSIYEVRSGGLTLRKFKTTALDGYQFYNGGYFMEKIGGLDWFLPRAVIIPEAGGPIRCFSDVQVDTSFWEKDCDYLMTTGTANIPENPTVEIYPNPTTGPVNITSSTPVQDIRVYDFSGKLLRTENGSRIDLKGLSGGLYFVSVRLENGASVSTRIIKK